MLWKRICQGIYDSIGSALLLSLAFSVLSRSCSLTSPSAFVGSVLPASLVFLAVILASARFSDIFESLGLQAVSGAAALLCIMATCIDRLALQIPIGAAASCLFSAGFACFLLSIGRITATMGKQERILFLAPMPIFGAVGTIILASMQEEAIMAMYLFLPFAAAMQITHIGHRFSESGSSLVYAERKSSMVGYHFGLSPLVITTIMGFTGGIVLAITLVSNGDDRTTVISPMAAMAFAGILYLIDSIRHDSITEWGLLRFFVTAISIGVVFLPFLPPIGQEACCAYLAFIVSLNIIMCFSAIGEVAYFNQISPYWVLGISYLCFSLGTIGGLILFGTCWISGASLPQAIACGCTIVILSASRDSVFQDNYPGNAELAESAVATKPALWQRKIDNVMNAFGLTERQQEVFRMLVRGRNAQYIADNFYISHSTAKAHIRNIYRKLGIHTQQELISMVEATDPCKSPTGETISQDAASRDRSESIEAHE